MGINKFNLNMSEFESFQSLIERNAPILDLLQNKALNAQIIRGTLVLKNGSAKLFALKSLLKVHGCKYDAATKTWRRPSVTTAERYAVGVFKAREATSKETIIDTILTYVNAVDKQRRDSSCVGMTCEPICAITPEARARAWARHGLELPTNFGGPRRDVYGNEIDVV